MAPTAEFVRVVVIDGDGDTRRRTSALLGGASDMEVVGLARSMTEGLKLAAAVEPAVLVVTVNFEQASCLDLIRRMAEEWPATAVLIVTRSSDALFIQDAVLAGAKGWLPQPVPAERLIAMIRQCAQRE